MKVHIDSDEVKSIIASLPKKKATGADAIPTELLQYMGNDGINLMTKIINNCYNTGELPEDFLSTTFITIPKVSGTQNCNEHQTISLSSHGSKVLLQVIKSRITPLIENRLGDSQLGFRKGRGTRDGICQLRLMSERLIEKNKKLFVCYIDYKKAFDKIKHVALSKMHAEYNVPNEEIRLISSIYDYQEAQIRINTSLFRKVEIKQGCILSPIVFNMYSEEVVNKALENDKGIVINGKGFTNIRYADDTVILADSEQNLQRMLNNIVRVCKDFGMELNDKKTKVMIIEKKPQTRIKIVVNDKQLEQVKDYRYLGTNISEDGRCIKEVKTRIALAKTAFWKHKELLKSNVSMSLKKKMIRSYIWSVVTYGSEAWTINKEIRNNSNAFDCWIYCRVLKIRWTDKVSNKEVLQRMGINMHLMNSIAKQKAAFFGHICRGSSGNDVVTILEGSVEGIRSRGAQRRKWSDDVKDWLNITDYGSLKRTSEDRTAWKVLIDNLRLP